MRSANTMTASQEILLAAEDLANAGTLPFTEWDLTVASWKRNRNRFGLRGYEDRYPDHKRVMVEVMTIRNPDNVVRRQFIRKVRKNYYEITNIGRAEAERLRHVASPQSDVRSPGLVFAAVEPYANDRAFHAWLKDPEEPRTWLGASTFFHLTKNDPTVLTDSIRVADSAVRNAISWCEENGKDVLPRGPHGGGAIQRQDLLKLQEFMKVLQTRFSRQIDAILAKAT